MKKPLKPKKTHNTVRINTPHHPHTTPWGSSRATNLIADVTNWRYYIRGRTETPGEDDLTIEKKRAQRLQPYDKYLRKFNYREALNAALQSTQVVVIVSLFEEFIRRKSVNTAISGLNEVTIQPLLNFLTRYVIDPKYSKTLVVISNFVLGKVYPR